MKKVAELMLNEVKTGLHEKRIEFIVTADLCEADFQPLLDRMGAAGPDARPSLRHHGPRAGKPASGLGRRSAERANPRDSDTWNA